MTTRLSLLLLVTAVWGFAQPAADFYVSPSGNDQWSGKLNAPNAAHTDGPFATVTRAQRAVREAKGARPVTVHLRTGTYFLTQPLTFNDQDSGAPDKPVTYAAFPGETPVLSGGVRLKNWHLDKSGHWQTTIPEIAKGEWTFSQLFVNGQRRYRPRLPKHGYFHVAQKIRSTPAAKDRGPDRFAYAPGEIKPEWATTDAEILVFHSWAMSRMRIASVDDKNHVVVLTGPTFREYHDMHKGDRFLVENVPDGLDTPGQWYLDRQLGVLTYIPKADEQIDTAEVIAPKLEHLVVINGAHHLRLQGITFEHSSWNAPKEGFSYAQGDVILPAAIEALNARHVEILRCHIQHTGAYAVSFGAGSKNNRLELSELIDLGAGGVKVGEIPAAMARSEDAEPARSEEALASNNVIRENNIEGGGRVQPAGIGIWIGHSAFNEVDHNRIHDFYYTGISVGWVWGFKPSLAQHNIIEENTVFKIGQGVLGDLGGIYTLGVSNGTVLRHNLIHDVQASSGAGRGIYLDEGSSGILVEDNVVYNTVNEAFALSYGRDDQVINNIFALSKNELIGAYKKVDGQSLDFERNILYWTQGKLTREPWESQNRIDRNLLWNPNGGVQEFGENCVIADPLFVNPETGDFRLKDDSPAVKIGFKPIPMEGMGLTVKLGKRVALERAY